MFAYLLEHITEEDKKFQFFLDRTNKHIELVQNAAAKIVDSYSEFKELLGQVEDHDFSKFEDPELGPYVNLTWLKKQNQKGDGEDQKAIVQATLHHVTTNSHHPEYHLEDKDEANINANDRDKSDKVIDASAMPDIDVAEMVADWQAMSEELKTNTTREWFESVKDVRWHFSDHQVELIDKLLGVFERKGE